MIVAVVALGVLIGLTLGAFGAGGSILAVPVLVLVAGLPAPAATATSLVAVGATALAAVPSHRAHIRFDVAAWFVPTGVVGALVGAAIARRADDDVLLLAFSVLMLVAAHRMFATKPIKLRPLSAAPLHDITRVTAADLTRHRLGQMLTHRPRGRLLAVAAAGCAVGLLTGVFGVGGGFVIVPALTLALGLKMRAAVATSLLIVAANAAIALVARGAGAVDWPIAVAITAPMVVGGLAGAHVGGRINADTARVSFAALLAGVALVNAAAVVV